MYQIFFHNGFDNIPLSDFKTVEHKYYLYSLIKLENIWSTRNKTKQTKLWDLRVSSKPHILSLDFLLR